jgi:tRNA uridine 5-carboxymethylaminomethyl modification enzyme
LRPGIHLSDLVDADLAFSEEFIPFNKLEIEQAEIQTKYGVYIQKEQEIAAKMQDLEALLIPESFDYHGIVALGTEARQKLTKVKPRTLGQASRISGVNPTDIQILMVYMGR